MHEAVLAQETRAVKLRILVLMFNSFLFLAWAAAALLFLLAVFRLFGRNGIVAFICVSVVLMNVLVTKSVRIFGIGATGGNVFDLEMLELRGRVAVVFSDLNLSWYWGDPMADARERGLQFGVNLIVFALTQPGGIANVSQFTQ